jgi:ArsR family transcriptional regulator
MLIDKPASTGAADASSGDSVGADIAIEQIASLCKASGDGLRLQILQLLRQDSLAVQELCTILDMRQPALSHHLKVMAGAGLVTRRREGNTIFYRRTVPDGSSAVGLLQEGILNGVDTAALTPRLTRRLQRLREEREQSSRRFFRENADKFRAQQDLIASYDQYADTVTEALESAMPDTRELALEIGPGDGAFLSVLGPRFEQVIAVDSAAEMLDKSQQRAREEQLENIEFIHGDTAHPMLKTVAANCIVVNMVLHHTPSPADIFADLANYLAPGGVLLVTDLCRHDQDWAREACGDLWLGFEPRELAAWAASAGLQEIAGIYLAQRNGFQVQVRLFGHQPIQQGTSR